MGAVFHNYKVLLGLSNKIKDNPLKNIPNKNLLVEYSNEIEGKVLYERNLEKWKGLICSLHREYEEILLKMLSEICLNKEYVSPIIK